MIFLSLLQWHPRLAPLWCGVLLVAAAAWVWWLQRQLRRRHPPHRARWLLLPKLMELALLMVVLFDPVSAIQKSASTQGKLLVAIDTSASMDVADDYRDARGQRARKIVANWKSALPEGLQLEALEFDTTLHKPGATAAGVRGTDLGAAVLALAERGDLAAYLGAVLLTDGGDEPVDIATLPKTPLFIVGIGTSPATWNDVAITEVQAPATAEKDVDFEIAADLEVRAGHGGGFAQKAARLPVTLERAAGAGWQKVAEQTVDAPNLRARAKLATQCSDTGVQRYRLTAGPIAGELSPLNNARIVTVNVQKKALRVLYFTRALGQEFKVLRNALARDPGLAFTALFRTAGERFTLQGDRLPGDESLAAGFPTTQKALEPFAVLIIGSVPAEAWTPQQMQALLQYVEGGGTVVFLGGDSSFGRGGFAQTSLASIFPWRLSDREPEPDRGTFPVRVPPMAAGNPILTTVSEAIARSAAVLDSVNRVADLKPGATALLLARVGGRDLPVIAVQPFGKGKVLGIASNTLWKWATQPEPLRAAYGLFWRQAVRQLTGKTEGGQNLAVRWDRDCYRPGERATGEIRVPGAGAGALRFTASLTARGQSAPVEVTPLPGQARAFGVALSFRARGDYLFRLVAYQGERVLETYEKSFALAPRVAEGTRLERDGIFLKNLTERGGGAYFPETEASRFVEGIAAKDLRKVTIEESSLVEAGPWLALAFVAALVAEWVLRRKWSLFALTLSALPLCAAEPRVGKVAFSDGSTLAGKISLTPGSELKLHLGQQLRTLPLDAVQELRSEPETKAMERAWRFLEAGKTAKEFTGQPYPVLYLKTTVVLAGGATLTGHLYTTVLYVEGAERTQKVSLLAQQRGKAGESFATVVYPKQITFGPTTAPTETTVRLRLTLPGGAVPTQVAALTRGPLVRLEASRAGAPGEFTLPSLLGKEIFLAARTGSKIVVGWPQAADASLLAQVRAALPDAEDFFDQRRVLGVFRDPADDAIYSLLLAARRGQTTLDATRRQPWRLEIYRWKADDDGKKLMLAGQGCFFRGIGAQDDPLPTVALSDKLWQVQRAGAAWSAGDE